MARYFIQSGYLKMAELFLDYDEMTKAIKAACEHGGKIDKKCRGKPMIPEDVLKSCRVGQDLDISDCYSPENGQKVEHLPSLLTIDCSKQPVAYVIAYKDQAICLAGYDPKRYVTLYAYPQNTGIQPQFRILESPVFDFTPPKAKKYVTAIVIKHKAVNGKRKRSDKGKEEEEDREEEVVKMEIEEEEVKTIVPLPEELPLPEKKKTKKSEGDQPTEVPMGRSIQEGDSSTPPPPPPDVVSEETTPKKKIIPSRKKKRGTRSINKAKK